ncbi:MAG: ATPase [Candidatus Saccharibacteria bacterium]|nr:ATPase [Candidatus Saccharibacteria bacterium]
MRQKQALAVMMSGANVFLTGAPGAGKTYVLNEFVKRAERAGKRVAVTASTGIAATHLGGTTIHSWSGLGILDALNDYDLERLGDSDKLAKRYNAVDTLVIDEVSMLHGYRLDMVSQLAKLLRGSDAPFGGMQVILVGDLFQLPPVSRGRSDFEFVHLSTAWAELDLQVCYITEQHRQADEDGLLDLLEAMRKNNFTERHRLLLVERLEEQPASHTPVTRLYAHNVDVESINQHHLGILPTDVRTYHMVTKGNKPKVETLMKSVLAPEVLELKVGAEVMFVANNFQEGFVNGSRGQVIDFEGDTPVVALTAGRIIKVQQHSWSLSEDGRVRAEVAQLPLRLAWAITIHKSQGLSLDAAEIDLSRAFTPGMGYVALSRVRSLDGLYLKGINGQALRMHPQIHTLDAELRRSSTNLANVTDDIADEVFTAADASAEPTGFDPILFEQLKAWRLRRAKADNVAPYMIAHNTTLMAVASVKPATPGQLLAMPGFGKSKVEKYADDILKLIKLNDVS